MKYQFYVRITCICTYHLALLERNTMISGKIPLKNLTRCVENETPDMIAPKQTVEIKLKHRNSCKSWWPVIVCYVHTYVCGRKLTLSLWMVKVDLTGHTSQASTSRKIRSSSIRALEVHTNVNHHVHNMMPSGTAKYIWTIMYAYSVTIDNT